MQIEYEMSDQEHKQLQQDNPDRSQVSIAVKIEQQLPIDYEAEHETSAKMYEYYKTRHGKKLEKKCK